MTAVTPATLLRDGVLDAESMALLWLLVEGGVPLSVIGAADLQARSTLAGAVLGLPPGRGWVVIDADADPPGSDRLAALLQGGVGLGLTMAVPDLRSLLEGPPSLEALPDDGLRRLGVVLVLDPVEPGLRCTAAHYLRPSERDGQGHVQRRPPAVLTSWDARDDVYEHFAWGITPELADRVDRSQADFEERQRDRAIFLQTLATDPGPEAVLEHRIGDYLASEPARVPALARSRARPSTFQGGLTDPDPHVH